MPLLEVCSVDGASCGMCCCGGLSAQGGQRTAPVGCGGEGRGGEGLWRGLTAVALTLALCLSRKGRRTGTGAGDGKDDDGRSGAVFLSFGGNNRTRRGEAVVATGLEGSLGGGEGSGGARPEGAGVGDGGGTPVAASWGAGKVLSQTRAQA